LSANPGAHDEAMRLIEHEHRKQAPIKVEKARR
jgi:hypothetical protein